MQKMRRILLILMLGCLIGICVIWAAYCGSLEHEATSSAAVSKLSQPIIGTLPAGPVENRSSSGTNTVPQTSDTGVRRPAPAEKTTDPALLPSAQKMLEVPYISQKGLLPTGCEIVSSLMLLRYYGYSVTADDFIDRYLDIGDFWMENGQLRAKHPSQVFIGNPRTEGGYGCFAPVIVNSLNRILSGGLRAEETGANSLAELAKTYISRGTPALVWASIGMIDITDGTAWTVWPSGEKFVWPANEHCLVLVGYDDKYYYFNDPYNGRGVVGYRKSLAESRYRTLGYQSVVIR